MIDMSKYKFDSGKLCVASEVPSFTMFTAGTEKSNQATTCHDNCCRGATGKLLFQSEFHDELRQDGVHIKNCHFVSVGIFPFPDRLSRAVLPAANERICQQIQVLSE
jgi:hypothetical protein